MSPALTLSVSHREFGLMAGLNIIVSDPNVPVNVIRVADVGSKPRVGVISVMNSGGDEKKLLTEYHSCGYRVQMDGRDLATNCWHAVDISSGTGEIVSCFGELKLSANGAQNEPLSEVQEILGEMQGPPSGTIMRALKPQETVSAESERFHESRTQGMTAVVESDPVNENVNSQNVPTESLREKDSSAVLEDRSAVLEDLSVHSRFMSDRTSPAIKRGRPSPKQVLTQSPEPVAKSSKPMDKPAELLADSSESARATPKSDGRVAGSSQPLDTHSQPTLHVVVTGSPALETKLKSRLKGVVLAKEGMKSKEVSCLFADSIKKTPKFMVALARGVPILHLNSATSYRKVADDIADPSCWLSDPAGERTHSFSLRHTILSVQSRGPIFKGKLIFVHKSVFTGPHSPSREDIALLCEAAGAEFTENPTLMSRAVCITAPNIATVRKLLETVSVVHTLDYLYKAIMQYSLEVEASDNTTRAQSNSAQSTISADV